MAQDVKASEEEETEGGAASEAACRTCAEVGHESLTELLGRYGLELRWAEPGTEIPGSYWGAPEAGLLGTEVWVRDDTPVHSMLHEACHTVCMDGVRRRALDTDAGGQDHPDGDTEESGVCYLQIVLANSLPDVGSERLMADMDAWGYSFRLGSTRAWFEDDAEDARTWLVDHGLLTPVGEPTWRLRD